MQVNMLNARNQLSRLVKVALAGEEVIIASHGKAQVRLVPCQTGAGLQRPGAMLSDAPELTADQIDAAFSEAVDQEVAHFLGASSRG